MAAAHSMRLPPSGASTSCTWRGLDGRSMGMKEIAKYLNQSGRLMRGRTWGIQKVCRVLSSTTYRGEHQYNVIESRTGKKQPPSEWIAVKIDPIVDSET